ncbi:MAG: hypothetical protein U5L11_00375 [Arhodomonas sp.]|nr:hypothetical protein [Arhodomonas sp.]
MRIRVASLPALTSADPAQAAIIANDGTGVETLDFGSQDRRPDQGGQCCTDA